MKYLCSPAAMPFSTAAPPNKRKGNRIITDLSNISQNGKKNNNKKTPSPHAHKFSCAGIQLYRSGNITGLPATVTLRLSVSVSK